MKDRIRKKKYCRPMAEELGMDGDGCLLHGSWKSVTVSGTRSSYDEMEDLDDTSGGDSRMGFFEEMYDDDV